jgi:hypothetical protein
MQLPEPIETYFHAENQGDVDTLEACFSPDAIVRDEGRTYEGLAAIKTWKAQTKQAYNRTIEPLQISQRNGRTVVTTKVSGSFPGSPVTLDFSFLVENNKTLSLETI